MYAYHERSGCLPGLMAAGLVMSSAALAGQTVAVYPTGLFPDDVYNVQAALDDGGSVLLKAGDAQRNSTAVNFGPHDFTGSGVNLNTDVVLSGEITGGHQTTIEGGFIPVLGVVPVKSRVEGIDFESPLGAAIILVASSGAEIVG